MARDLSIERSILQREQDKVRLHGLRVVSEIIGPFHPDDYEDLDDEDKSEERQRLEAHLSKKIKLKYHDV